MDHINHGESSAPTSSDFEESPETGEGAAPTPGESVDVGLGVESGVGLGVALAEGLGVGLGDDEGTGEPILVATDTGRMT